MEEREYNWGAILKAAIPVSVIVGYIYYRNFSVSLRWISLIVGVGASGLLVYIKDKKKGNIFTAMAIVILVAVIIRLLKRIGIII